MARQTQTDRETISKMTAQRIFPAFHVYMRALREVRAVWPHLVIILLLGLLWTPIALLAPLPMKMIVDNVLGTAPLPWFLDELLPRTLTTSPEGMLKVAIGLSVLLALIGMAHSTSEWLLRENVTERMVREFRGRMLLHSLLGSIPHHHAKGSHDPAYRIYHDAPALPWTTIYGILPVIISAMSLCGMLYVTALINGKLALVACATSLPLIVLIHLNQRCLRARWHDVAEKDSGAHSTVQEALGALSVVVTFRQERREVGRFLDRAQAAFRARLGVMWLQGGFGVILGLSSAFGITAILYLGVRDVQAHVLSVGDLLLVMGYIGQLYAPLQGIGMHVTGQQQALASIERACALLDDEPTVADREGAIPLQRAIGDIGFENVSFAYAGDREVLSGVSVEVPAGSCVGIVGKTGAGKTTLINLLARLLDPTAGRIRLDGIDLRDYRLADLRDQFAVVPQEPVLFSTTVAENIAYGCPDAPMEAIVEAAKLAEAHDFISALPDGYRTNVGERGMLLSGGERQRIVLARAFLKDAPILILDEPTSSIDLETEGELFASMERLMHGRTTFLIAHRLSTLRNADFILRVKGGGVVLEQADQLFELLKA
jgi:ATP-binding cassette, subfamily B, bacterial